MHGDLYLSFETVTPITLYLGYDKRIGDPVAWLTDDANGFVQTNQRIKTDDTEFDVYRQDHPAGRVQLGGNFNDAVDANKSNFVWALRRRPFPLLEQHTTVDEAVAKLPTANAARGQALFYVDGGATCSTCHRADASGVGYGPGLSHLVKSNDRRHVIQSILEPSVKITEGFAEQVVETGDGRTITGLLRAETDAGISLIQKDGQSVFVKREEIDKRYSQNISPMPVFATLLTAQQVADLSSWLLKRDASRAELEPELSRAKE